MSGQRFDYGVSALSDLRGDLNPYRGINYVPLSGLFYVGSISFDTLEAAMAARDRREAKAERKPERKPERKAA